MVEEVTDRLAGFFRQYSFRAKTFYTGTLCENELFNEEGIGHLHLLRKGHLKVTSPVHETIVLNEPSLLFYPQPTTHRFYVDKEKGADLVCATIDLGWGEGNPLTLALPEFFCASFNQFPDIETTSALLFSEAFSSECARQAAIERLTEYLLIQLLRSLMDDSNNSLGLMAGLADKKLAKALVSMHDHPEKLWTLNSLACVAGMSRARFAVYFREVVGMTPASYLTKWRIGLTQAMLQKGQPMSLIALEVGYTSASALSRAFRAQTGFAPREWIKRYRNEVGCYSNRG